jgi:drug/metabolite transporter (DMT)-like permease
LIQNFLRTPKRKGYFFAALSALAVSNVYIFSKAALRETDLFVFGFFWFLSAFVYNLVYTISTRKFNHYFTYTNRQKLVLLVIGLIETMAAFTFFKGVSVIENPTIVSFLDTCTPLFTTILGIIFLRDRFNKIELSGMALAIAGAVLISYSGTFNLSGLFIYGSHFAILAAIFASIGITVAKSQIKAYDPAILSFNRTIYLVALFFVLLLVYKKPFSITTQSFIFAAIGSFAGPFLGAILQYNAFKYIEASKTMIIQSTRSFIVLIVSLLFFGLFPLYHQLLGGLMAITGVIIIALGSTRINHWNK